jgi:hypothetical protein
VLWEEGRDSVSYMRGRVFCFCLNSKLQPLECARAPDEKQIVYGTHHLGNNKQQR